MSFCSAVGQSAVGNASCSLILPEGGCGRPSGFLQNTASKRTLHMQVHMYACTGLHLAVARRSLHQATDPGPPPPSPPRPYPPTSIKATPRPPAPPPGAPTTEPGVPCEYHFCCHFCLGSCAVHLSVSISLHTLLQLYMCHLPAPQTPC
jgi:hypothetical protein